MISTILILFNLLTSLSTAANLYPDYPCGEYRARGRLRTNNLGQTILVLREGSFSPMEFVFLGGDADQKEILLSRDVTAKFYVPQLISGPKRPLVFLRDLQVSTRGSGIKVNEVKLIEKHACYDKKMYRR